MEETSGRSKKNTKGAGKKRKLVNGGKSDADMTGFTWPLKEKRKKKVETIEKKRKLVNGGESDADMTGFTSPFEEKEKKEKKNKKLETSVKLRKGKCTISYVFAEDGVIDILLFKHGILTLLDFNFAVKIPSKVAIVFESVIGASPLKELHTPPTFEFKFALKELDAADYLKTKETLNSAMDMVNSFSKRVKMIIDFN